MGSPFAVSKLEIDELIVEKITDAGFVVFTKYASMPCKLFAVTTILESCSCRSMASWASWLGQLACVVFHYYFVPPVSRCLFDVVTVHAPSTFCVNSIKWLQGQETAERGSCLRYFFNSPYWKDECFALIPFGNNAQPRTTFTSPNEAEPWTSLPMIKRCVSERS